MILRPELSRPYGPAAGPGEGACGHDAANLFMYVVRMRVVSGGVLVDINKNQVFRVLRDLILHFNMLAALPSAVFKVVGERRPVALT